MFELGGKGLARIGCCQTPGHLHINHPEPLLFISISASLSSRFDCQIDDVKKKLDWFNTTMADPLSQPFSPGEEPKGLIV